MSYNIDPSFNYSSITSNIGWLGGGYNYYYSYTFSGWYAYEILLNNPGIYLATFSVQFNNSPNAFIYITTSNSSTGSGSIPPYNTGLNYNVANMGTYVNTSFFKNGVTIPQNFGNTFNNYQVLAGSVQLNSNAGASAGLTTLAPVYNPSNNGTELAFFINSQTDNVNTALSINIIRIG